MPKELRCSDAAASAGQLHPYFDGQKRKLSHLRCDAVLRCSCDPHAVQLRVAATPITAFLSGSRALWRGKGALFSFVAEVPRNAVAATRHGDKLHLSGEGGPFRRLTCRDCATPLAEYAATDRSGQAGPLLIYPERSPEMSRLAPEFAIDLEDLRAEGCTPSEIALLTHRLEGHGVEIR